MRAVASLLQNSHVMSDNVYESDISRIVNSREVPRSKTCKCILFPVSLLFAAQTLDLLIGYVLLPLPPVTFIDLMYEDRGDFFVNFGIGNVVFCGSTAFFLLFHLLSCSFMEEVLMYNLDRLFSFF